MRKPIHIRQYFDYILKEVGAADTEFKMQQIYYRNVNAAKPGTIVGDSIAELTADQLAVQQAEIVLHLKQVKPGLLSSWWLRLTGKDSEKLYALADNNSQTMQVTFTISRVDAFSKLSGAIQPDEANDIALVV